MEGRLLDGGSVGSSERRELTEIRRSSLSCEIDVDEGAGEVGAAEEKEASKGES